MFFQHEVPEFVGEGPLELGLVVVGNVGGGEAAAEDQQAAARSDHHRNAGERPFCKMLIASGSRKALMRKVHCSPKSHPDFDPELNSLFPMPEAAVRTTPSPTLC